MKKTCALVMVFVTLLMTSNCSIPDNREKDLTVSVMSFNIRYATEHDGHNQWNNRKTNAFGIIRNYSPDVIGLQEALRSQLDELHDALPLYGEIGVGRDGGADGEYSAILYRTDRYNTDDSGTFWLSNTPDKPSRHWGNACIRICTWARFVDRTSGRAFYLYNTHLDHESQISRERSVRLIVSRIQARKHKDRFILTGDFNAGEGNPAIMYLKGAELTGYITPIPLVDSFRVLHPDDTEVGTFNAFAGITNGAKIDYVFIEPGTPVLDAAIVRTETEGRYPSDHFPVTARTDLDTSQS